MKPFNTKILGYTVTNDNFIEVAKVISSKYGVCPALNTLVMTAVSIPLSKWDRIAGNLYDVTPKMKAAGDYLTLAGGVCIAKAAARQIANR
jgi:hypothetical protein